MSLLDPRVMADPIVFLASPEAEGITGERIVAAEISQVAGGEGNKMKNYHS